MPLFSVNDVVSCEVGYFPGSRNSVPQADCKGSPGKSHRVTSSTGTFSFVPGRGGSCCPWQEAGQPVGQRSRVVLPCFGATPVCPVRPRHSQLIPLPRAELARSLSQQVCGEKGLCRGGREFPVSLLKAEPSWTPGHGASLPRYCQISPSFLPELSLGGTLARDTFSVCAPGQSPFPVLSWCIHKFLCHYRTLK